MRTMPRTFVRAMTQQTTNILLLCLFRVKHGNQQIEVVNNTEPVQTSPNIVGVGKTVRWQPFPFSITLPQEGNNQVPTIPVQVVNVSQEVSAFARAVSVSPDEARADIYIVSFENPDDVLLRFENFNIQNVQYNISTVTFDLRLHQQLERAFVKETFRPGTFPNLFN